MRPYNDVDLYVEDQTLVGIYERLANFALQGRGKVTKIIPLGPREAVLNAAMADVAPGGRPRLYIVDSDLDLIAFGKRPQAPRLFRLRSYSIENVLFESEALGKYISYSCPSMPEMVARGAIDIPILLDSIKHLLPFFAVLAVARRLKLSGPAYRMDVSTLFKIDSGHKVEIDAQGALSRVRMAVRAIVDSVGWRKYRDHRAAVQKIAKSRRLDPDVVVSGKYFLIPLLNGRVGRAGGVCHRVSTIASYLADHCTLARDRELRRRIRNLLPA
jgi:hypothetical protein